MITATSGQVQAMARVTVTDPARSALTALYNATNGGGWTNNANWLSDAPLANWFGVATNADGRVTALDLGNNNLEGTIPPEIGRLIHLEGLALDGNELTGPIPTELGQLTNLTHLYLYGNELTGPIPAELGSLTRLVHLCINSNRSDGSPAS